MRGIVLTLSFCLCGATGVAAGVLNVPVQYQTIQLALDQAAPGDTVLLAAGVYRGDGNRDLDYNGKAVTVRSVAGDPALCVIDCEGSEVSPHRGFYFHSQEGSGSVLEGVTVRNGYAADQGGGILCWGDKPDVVATPAVRHCRITRCSAPRGAGLAVANVNVWPLALVQSLLLLTPPFTACVVDSNDGEGIRVDARVGLTVAVGCSFTGNSGHGGAVTGVGTGNPGGIVFDDCQLTGNGGDGLYHLGDASRLRLLGCELDDNVGRGFASDGGGDEIVQLQECAVRRNGGGGVSSADFDVALTLEDCKITDNDGFGVLATLGGFGLQVLRTRITGNSGHGLTDGGIVARRPAVRAAGLGWITRIDSCLVADNGRRGIDLTGWLPPGAVVTITHSTVSRNGKEGLYDALRPAYPGAGDLLQLAASTIAGNGDAGVVFASDLPCSLGATIIAGNTGVGIWREAGVTPVVACTNIFGNGGGDWLGEFADQACLRGNFSLDPWFCHSAPAEYSLRADSPCLPAANSCAVLIGAHDRGCDTLVVGVGPDRPRAPGCRLLPVHPNPANPGTAIVFDLPAAAAVRLTVYDLAGRPVRRLLDGARLDTGRHEVAWDGRGDNGHTLATGTYLCRLQAGGTSSGVRISLVR
ncbi:MAG: right-handed parallel beta-helix repeat-containing protein [Candidatus Krumholzibacteriia bacterium]